METKVVKHEHTCKLYYHTYLWKVKLIIPCIEGKGRGRSYTDRCREETLHPIISWISSHVTGEYRLLKSWRKIQSRILNVIGKRPKVKTKILNFCHFTMFIDNEQEYLDFVNQFQNYVDATCSPANKSHEDLIREGNNLDVRKDLYFGAYRYKITFWGGGWRGRWSVTTSVDRVELKKDIKNHLYDDSKDVVDQDYYIIEFNNTLYLKNKSDFTMIKLSMADIIRKITIIVLPDEIVTSQSI
jgi:hypothetical protein